MIFDSDVLIWVLRGNRKAARVMDGDDERAVSIVSYMEVLRGARNGTELRETKLFFRRQNFQIIPLTENTGHRAVIYIELYSLRADLSVADALIAATAAENKLVLCTGNRKHFSAIRGLEVRAFRPH